MYLQIAITLFLLGSVAALFILVYKSNKRLVIVHEHTISELESCISRNTFQIKSRTNNLNKYDFLKYNLNEALVAQMEVHT
jgi:hypothetical protein